VQGHIPFSGKALATFSRHLEK